VNLRYPPGEIIPLTENASANDAQAEMVGVRFTVAVNTFANDKQLNTPIVTETGWPSSAVVGVTLKVVSKPLWPQQRVH